MISKNFLKNYGFSLILLGSIFLGSVTGFFLKDKAVVLKPFGDIFLNLLFTAVVPLVFFSLSSAVAGMQDLRRLGKIFALMLVIFAVTGIIAALFMAAGVSIFPPAEGFVSSMSLPQPAANVDLGSQIVSAFTASDFRDLLSKKNMLALIVFSLLVGLAASKSGEPGKPFVQFLLAGNAVMSRVIKYIMFYAPVGLGAYFGYLVGIFGPQLAGPYLRVVILYYPMALFYFFAAFSLYAFFAAGFAGVKKFWANIIPTALTAWATGSSVATIPTNLAAAKKIGIPEDVREVVIPVGATIHMEGSALAAVVKIAFLFGIFHMSFSGAGVILSAVGIALLCGVVISGIPAGGMLGEMLIISLYGFPIEAMPLITMIGTLVDPPATMVNAVGDNVAGMMVARILNGRKGNI